MELWKFPQRLYVRQEEVLPEEYGATIRPVAYEGLGEAMEADRFKTIGVYDLREELEVEKMVLKKNGVKKK